MKLPDLPTYYYLDHFREMLSFIETTYSAILEPTHHDFIGKFRSLSGDEQCLFVRIVNRRGQVFDRRGFKYPEITDMPAAVRNLMREGYLRKLEEGDFAALLCLLKKETLLSIAKTANRRDVRTSWSKAKLIEYFLVHVPFSIAAEHVDTSVYVVLADTRPIEFMLYLYFGKTQKDLRSFALRDLGVLRSNDAASFKARFANADEARACFYYSQVLDGLSAPSLAVYQEAVESVYAGPKGGGDYTTTLRDRAAYEIGIYFERQKDHGKAIDLYRFASSPECNERLARLLYATGRRQEAGTLLERMIDDPGSDEEFTFAEDFYARKFGGRRTSACTELLRAGAAVAVDESHRGNPEAGVAGILRRNGWKVYHTENLLWLNLFGLLFWDELFESGQLNSGFDWVPQCLVDKSFAPLFDDRIKAKIAAIRAGKALPILLKSIATRWGRPNGVFSWTTLDVDALRELLAFENTGAIAAVIELMAGNYPAARDGFPDLMIAKDGLIRFIEIKAEGDVLRRNQLTRLRQLQTAGFGAEIFRVEYRFDPEQDYVVVDIETTGGWASSDRITEIGAVKIRNHQVIGEWHSLINPQRLIPAKIVQLTGITNEIVKYSPVFAEIADALMAFMGDGIFVAHNVNFDYGFIAEECARIERRFRFPKFCTCAGMRRHFPGHASYSLGNLCEIYAIALESHHRALCDARAAGQLLNLINRKREDCTLKRREVSLSAAHAAPSPRERRDGAATGAGSESVAASQHGQQFDRVHARGNSLGGALSLTPSAKCSHLSEALETRLAELVRRPSAKDGC